MSLGFTETAQASLFFFYNQGIMENTEQTPKKHRTRERKGYFYEREEDAVKRYLTCEDETEKNEIFNTILRPAFTKMIESIIRRYKLYVPDEEFQETFDDTISFLMMKIQCFNPNKNYKAYSYCGTICKNYLMGKINQYAKRQDRSSSFDTEAMQEDLTDNIDYSYSTENEPKSAFLSSLTGLTIGKIEQMVNERRKFNLNDSEYKIGKALILILEHWEEIFTQMGSNKFNKSYILLLLKEYTTLSSKEIREGMKRFKEHYYLAKHELIER